MKVLNLGYNNGNSSKGKLLKPIVPQVQANKTPKKLIFAGNELKTEHCKEFMEALKSNTSLVSLDVSSNSLDNAMGDLLVEVLQTNKTLRRIKHAHSLHEKDINKRLAGKILSPLFSILLNSDLIFFCVLSKLREYSC